MAAACLCVPLNPRDMMRINVTGKQYYRCIHLISCRLNLLLATGIVFPNLSTLHTEHNFEEITTY